MHNFFFKDITFKFLQRTGLFWVFRRNKNVFSNFYILIRRCLFVYLSAIHFFNSLRIFFYFFKFLEKKKLDSLFLFKYSLKKYSQKSNQILFGSINSFQKNFFFYFFNFQKAFLKSSFFFLTTKESYYHLVYQTGKELGQPSFSYRWIPGVISNFQRTSFNILKLGLLDQRLLYQIPDFIFFIGTDFKVFNEIKFFKRPICGLVDSRFPVNYLDFSFVINDNSFLGVFFLFNLFKQMFKALYRY